MKIGKFYGFSRRPNIPVPPPIETDNSAEAVAPKHKKRALLIGVTAYLFVQEVQKNDGKQGMASRSGEGVLKGPHNDVKVMKKLLVEKYGYQEKDITTLLDDKDPKHKQPTKENMLAEIHNLVRGAMTGDRFFFHYAGHAVQVPNVDNKEEDGMDECLVPCDSNGNDDKLIKDDVLRNILVDKLPVGCQLVAIFDSCHSASLLDLKHFRCNRVYVPWMSKGRRQSDSMWNANVRKQAALVSNRVVYQAKRMTNNLVKSRRTSQDLLTGPQQLPPTPASYQTEFGSGSVSSSSSPVNIDQDASTGLERRMTRTRQRQSVATIRSNLNLDTSGSWLGGEKSVCDSPVNEFCDGLCRGPASPTTPKSRRSTFGNGKSPNSMLRLWDRETQHGDVISLGSCKDDQLAWEDSMGTSMTQSLVDILSRDPHPTFKDLMVKVSHEMHSRLLNIHQETKSYKKSKKLWRIRKRRKRSLEGDTKGLEMNNFQDPQLSSMRPLDMSKKWDL
ncbi:hypothetical protein VNI00_009364 [Paramarasmius palmivorus]|uniref:Peptidase C14 caspase domain-containing protein n=1 Tax=Paramarasmius palmivorus TaxID=297713 RepID=A0AAW0CSN6_9AGAR